jgi:C1A family cysteine protease
MYRLDIEKSPTDARDWSYGSKVGLTAAPVLPESLDLRSGLPPVRNQGQEGACAAFSAASLREWQERKEYGATCYFSPQFVYWNRENLSQSGMYLRDVMNILRKKGICPEDLCAQGKVASPEQITPEAKSAAENFLIKGYAQVTSPTELKAALNTSGPCLIAMPVFQQGPIFWKPTVLQKQVIGGHCVTVVGYDHKKGFLLRNSWGSMWGDDGYTWYPYEDWGSHWEIWSAVDEVTDTQKIKDFNLTRKACC